VENHVPISSSCPSRERLEQLLLGRIFGADADSLVEHLENCGECQASAQGVQAADTLVDAIRELPDRSPLEDPVVDQLIERVSGLLNDAPVEESGLEMLDPPVQPDELGRLGPYRVLRVLGRGGMGLVFQAEELPLGRLVALKVVRPSLAANLTIRRRFLREARAVAAIDDERIVPIYHTGEERGIPYIAMQLLEGQTLDEYLRDFEQASGRRAVWVDVAVAVGREVALGLAAAHQRGVIHRDVKPGNIFLKGTAPLTVKLLDFGLARGVEEELSLTHPGVAAGTPAYVAPEQVAGGPIDTSCDLFSLGCTLYRMVTGRTPFDVEPLTARRPDIAHPCIAPPRNVNPDVPQELSDLILRLLATDPARRPASAHDVALQLAGIGACLASSESGGMHSTSPANSPKGRRRATLLAAIGVTLILFTATAYQVLLKHDIAGIADTPFEAWLGQVALLSERERVEAVVDKLQELNPGFDGQISTRFEEGRLVELQFITDAVSDIRPVGALRNLEVLACRGSESAKGQLEDLRTVTNLASLAYLDFSANRVHDLSPLQGLPLRELIGWANPIEDLRPLEKLPLITLDVSFIFAADLSPLAQLQLTKLLVRAPYALDFVPLERLPLREIHCDFRPNRHARSLRAIRTLQLINDLPAADFWSAFDARKKSMKQWLPRVIRLPAEQRLEAVLARLRELNPEFDDTWYPTIEGGEVVELQFFVDKVTDVSPLRAFTRLTRLKILGTEPGKGRLFDLDPLRDLPLELVNVTNTQVAELSVLRRMPIKAVICTSTPVRDLSPLRALTVVYLDCRSSRVDDLAPLKGLKITYLDVSDCPISDFSPLRELPVDRLFGSFDRQRDGELLDSMTSLKEINGHPAAEFLQTFADPATEE
jgi:serine/threonine protein kinase